ncbi:MAG: transglutaminase domain-containing protein [Candidatus Cloacimonetes bacterium]|nr:transglutaminase domain-containing protein [Candidatus Cloacimonadota bacterium]
MLILVSAFFLVSISCATENYHLSYQVTIPKPLETFKSMKVWLPLPKNTHEQTFEIDQIVTPVSYTLNQDKKYNNQMLYFDLSKIEKFPVTIDVKTFVDRKIAKFSRLKNAVPIQEWSVNKFLSSNVMIPNDNVLFDLANDASRGSITRFSTIKALYLKVVDKMKYSKHGQGWGKGDALWACNSEYGNCTDFHSVLIGMARSIQIPARFEIGLPIPKSKTGTIGGYHCWARLYDSNRGWIPVDASESYKTGVPLRFFGKLPADRIHFSTGRDIILSPAQESAPLNYFIYPYIEIDGVQSNTYTKSFTLN